MIDPLQWMPVLYALSAPLLAWLLVLGRRSPRRATQLIALAAALAVLVDLTILAVAIWGPQPIAWNTTPWSLVTLAAYAAPVVAGAFGTAVWVLLLADAAGGAGGGAGGDRRRLVLLALVYALALLIGIGLPLREPLLAPLRGALFQLGGAGGLLSTALENSAAIAAVVVAFAFPASTASALPLSTSGRPEPIPPAIP